MTRNYITLLLYRRSLVELYIAFRHSIELTPVIDMHSYLRLIIVIINRPYVTIAAVPITTIICL